MINHQVINVTSLRNSVCLNIKENKLCICMKELFNAELLSYPKNYLHLMELRFITTFTRAGPHSEPDESCHHLPFCFFKILCIVLYFNITLTSLSRSPSGSRRFLHQNFVHTSLPMDATCLIIQTLFGKEYKL